MGKRKEKEDSGIRGEEKEGGMGYVGGGGREGDTKENGTARVGVVWQGRK